MGTVELLTREGEIEIAKLYRGWPHGHDGGHFECPAVIAEVLVMAEEIRQDKSGNQCRGDWLLTLTKTTITLPRKTLTSLTTATTKTAARVVAHSPTARTTQN